jgi:PAS domain-containing protein
MQLFNLVLGFFIYLPFVRFADKVRKYRFESSYGELLHAGSGKRYEALADQPGEIGTISRVLANDLLASIKKNEHSLLKNTPGVTFMLDLRMHFVLGSEKTAALLGYNDIQEMAGLSLEALFSRVMPDSWTSDISRSCARVIESAESLEFEESVTPNSGQARVFQITITQAEEQGGVCRGVVIVMNDIS